MQAYFQLSLLSATKVMPVSDAVLHMTLSNLMNQVMTVNYSFWISSEWLI